MAGIWPQLVRTGILTGPARGAHGSQCLLAARCKTRLVRTAALEAKLCMQGMLRLTGPAVWPRRLTLGIWKATPRGVPFLLKDMVPPSQSSRQPMVSPRPAIGCPV
jgi:hypothetical protein